MKIDNIDEYKLNKKEHVVSEMICINCKHRAIHTRPSDVLSKNLECSQCHETGYLIETGQALE